MLLKQSKSGNMRSGERKEDLSEIKSRSNPDIADDDLANVETVEQAVSYNISFALQKFADITVGSDMAVMSRKLGFTSVRNMMRYFFGKIEGFVCTAFSETGVSYNPAEIQRSITAECWNLLNKRTRMADKR